VVVVGIKFILGDLKMLTLKIKNKDVEPSYNYRLYKNIAGDDKDKRKENFYSFLDGLFSDDSITIINFLKQWLERTCLKMKLLIN
jgi:hypothetical protein